MYVCQYIYIYICVCVCFFMLLGKTTNTLRLTNMEVENPLFVKESSLPKEHVPLPC